MVLGWYLPTNTSSRPRDTSSGPLAIARHGPGLAAGRGHIFRVPGRGSDPVTSPLRRR